MTSYMLINYFPQTKNYISISTKNLHIEDKYMYKYAMNTDPDLKTIKNNEQHYYLYVSIDFLKSTPYDQIINSIENVINNKVCSIDIPVFISIKNKNTDYTWLNDDSKTNFETIVVNEYNKLSILNSYYANKTY